MVRQQREHRGHRAVAPAGEAAVERRRFPFTVACGFVVPVFRRRGVMMMSGRGRLIGVVAAMHGARPAVGSTHRTMRRRRRLVSACFRWPVSGTALARHERGQPRDLEHQPGEGDEAQPPAKHCHGSVSSLTERRHQPQKGTSHAACQRLVPWAGVRTRVRSGHRALSSRYEPVHLADLPPRPRLELILEHHRGLDDEPCAGLDAMPLSRAIQMSKGCHPRPTRANKERKRGVGRSGS